MSFVGVLVVTSSLVLFLFNEASAVDVHVTVPSGTLRTSTGKITIPVSIAIPSGQLVPIGSLRAVLEQTAGSTHSLPTTIDTATCTSLSGCSAPSVTGVKPTAITAIGASSSNPSPSAGYLSVTNAGSTVVATDINELSGYGYGYGYGYGGVSGGTLSFTVTVDLGVVGTGDYWLTFTLHTRSSVIGDISSAPAHFHVDAAEQVIETAGHTVDSTPAPTSGAEQAGLPPTVTHNDDGSTSATIEIPSDFGLTAPRIDLHAADPRLSTLQLDPATTPAGSQVTVRVSSTPFTDAGATSIPTSFAPGTLFLEIEVIPPPTPAGSTASSSPETSTAALSFKLDTNGGSTDSIVLLHFHNGAWVAEETSHIFDYNGQAVYISNVHGFSPFAVVTDTQPPTVSFASPLDGKTVGVRPLIAATLSDNRGIAAQKTSLSIDGQYVPATITNRSVRFSSLVPFTPGAHTATVRATDLSGLVTTTQVRFTVAAGADPAAPTVMITSPANGTYLAKARPTLTATLADDKAVDASSVIVLLDGLSVPAKITPTSVVVAPDVDLAEGAHELAVSADDFSGNGGYAVSQFFVDTKAPNLAASVDWQVCTLKPVVDASDASPIRVAFSFDGVDLPLDQAGSVYSHSYINRQPSQAHTWTATVTDAAGNEKTATGTLSAFPSDALCGADTGGATPLPGSLATPSSAPSESGTAPGAVKNPSGRIPGFASVAAIAAIGAVAILLRRRK